MKGSEAQLLGFMEGANNRYVIPVYQRKYDWKIENCRQHRDEFVIRDGSTGQLKLSPALARCGNTDVRNEIVYIRQNSPEIFENGNFDEGQTR